MDEFLSLPEFGRGVGDILKIFGIAMSLSSAVVLVADKVPSKL
ncbi:MAG: hypothetical protein ACTSR8_00445 [Promethearchaeota archaeon]